MRMPDWTPGQKPQPKDLVDAILARRGGTLINLDKALLWSEPLARGWNTQLKAVRSELPTRWKLRELGICTVALLTGAELDALNQHVLGHARDLPTEDALGLVEKRVIQYAAQMTLDVKGQDAVFSALQQHFAPQIVELTSAIATSNRVARFLVALGVSPEDRAAARRGSHPLAVDGRPGHKDRGKQREVFAAIAGNARNQREIDREGSEHRRKGVPACGCPRHGRHGNKARAAKGARFPACRLERLMRQGTVSRGHRARSTRETCRGQV